MKRCKYDTKSYRRKKQKQELKAVKGDNKVVEALVEAGDMLGVGTFF